MSLKFRNGMRKMKIVYMFLRLSVIICMITAFIIPMSRANFSFAVTGDEYNFPAIRVAFEDAKARDPQCAFVFDVGDMGSLREDGILYTDYNLHYYPDIEAWNGSIPWFAVIGNHDVERPEVMEYIMTNVTPRYENQVQGIENFREGPKDADYRTIYSFDYQNAHFVVLNEYYHEDRLSPDYSPTGHIYRESGNPESDQMAWLENDLNSTDKELIFVFGHEPAYPASKRHLGDSLDHFPEDRDEFWNVLVKYNVTAFFNGHTHVYARTVKKGVYQVDAGLARTRAWYVLVKVRGDNVIFETYKRTAEAYFDGRRRDFELIETWATNTHHPEWKSMTPGSGGWITALDIDINSYNHTLGYCTRVFVGGDVLGAAVSNDGGITWQPTYGLKMYEIENFEIPKAPYGEKCFLPFAATVGGIYESFDCENWYQRRWTDDDMPSASYTSVSAPFAGISQGINLLAGTGEMRRTHDPSLYGDIYAANIFSDTLHWRLLYTYKNHSGNFSGDQLNIQDIVVDPFNSSRFMISFRNNGVWLFNVNMVDREPEFGGTEKRSNGLPSNETYTLAADYSHQGVFYVATGDHGVYKTTDYGNSWFPITNGYDIRTQTIATTRIKNKNNTLYTASYGPHRGVWKTEDGGTTWTHVLNESDARDFPYSQASMNIRYHALSVDPYNHSHVIVGDDVNLYVTFDGGETWLSGGGITRDGGQTWTGSNFSGMCGNFIAFDWNNKNHMLLGGSDGALWQTNDHGQTFERPVTDTLGPNDDPGEVFTDFIDGAISPQNPNTIYLIGDIGGDSREDYNGPLFRSTDGGDTWQLINEGPFNSIAIKPDNESTILAAGKGEIFRSTDGGFSFLNVTGDIGALRISTDPANSSVMYATSTQGVYKTTDGGKTWENIGGPSVWWRFSKVAVDPTNTTTLYTTSFSGFWKYDGNSWTKVKSVEYATDITVTNDGIVYGATTSFPNHDMDPLTTGVWRSTDKGKTWYLDKEGLRVSRIITIKASPIENLVIAGTDCGGFFSQKYSSNKNCHPADSDCDSKISIKEVVAFIQKWLNNEVEIHSLIQAIKMWKNR